MGTDSRKLRTKGITYVTHETPEKLAKCPPNGEDSQGVLVCCWYEFYSNGEDTISFNQF